MSRGTRGATDKFSCETSRFLLPTFRRPCYREIMDTPVQDEAEHDIFSRWTKEDGQYYAKINLALLNDDYDVLKENVHFINNLRKAIKNNNHKDTINLYRGLCISAAHVKQEYKVGLQFLSCTSKNRDIAHVFGDYTFEIEATDNDWTYRADISKYSMFPEEEEVVFYPYSGFIVKNIIPDAKVIQLKCMDTLSVEETSEKRIPETVKISDESRNMFVYFYKKSNEVHWCYADKPEQMYLIAGNQNGYWDAPYRYHHRRGYFIDKGENIWEEYQKDQLFASFHRVS